MLLIFSQVKYLYLLNLFICRTRTFFRNLFTEYATHGTSGYESKILNPEFRLFLNSLDYGIIVSLWQTITGIRRKVASPPILLFLSFVIVNEVGFLCNTRPSIGRICTTEPGCRPSERASENYFNEKYRIRLTESMYKMIEKWYWLDPCVLPLTK